MLNTQGAAVLTCPDHKKSPINRILCDDIKGQLCYAQCHISERKLAVSRSDIIDLRSDTVTRPNQGMRAAMAAAPVGDDVFDDDRTVQSLEARVADLLGKDAGLFLPSGTQSNLCGLLTHCGRGQEILTGEHYHVFADEARGVSVLGGVSLHPLSQDHDGSLDPARITAAVKPDDSHFPETKLLSMENSHWGQVIGLQRCIDMASAARTAGLAVHLDGARLANAALEQQLSLEGACFFADTVSFCLSKGLGAPLGSVLAGPKPFIARARRLRKMLGGGMRQVGIVAAAGHYALDEHLPKLAEDHHRARMLDDGLADTNKLRVIRERTQTNMVYISLPQGGFATLQKTLQKLNVFITGSDDSVRLVCHHDHSDADIDLVISAINRWAAA